MSTELIIHDGADVIGSDGEKVGEVQSIAPNYIVVEKGFFFPTDYYIPTAAISGATEKEVYLTVTKDEALNQSWDVMPTETEAGYAAATEPYAENGARSQDAGRQTEETVARVPVHEEELIAGTRQGEAGEVRISKEVVTEHQTIDVPVREERVRVDYRAPSGETPTGEATFEEGTIEVPVRREEVDVQKRVKQTGEVHVTKEVDEHTEHVTDTVRKERVDVDDATAPALAASEPVSTRQSPKG